MLMLIADDESRVSVGATHLIEPLLTDLPFPVGAVSNIAEQLHYLPVNNGLQVSATIVV